MILFHSASIYVSFLIRSLIATLIFYQIPKITLKLNVACKLSLSLRDMFINHPSIFNILARV